MEAVDQEKHYVGQVVLPVYPSAVIVGRYPKFTKQSGELLKAQATKRGATGTYNEIDRKFEWDSYQTEEYGLEERVDDVVATQMEDFFDAEMITGKLLMNALMLDYEISVASAVMNTTTFPVVNTANVSYTEALIGTMDVPADITAIIENLTMLGEEPNTMILSLPLFNRIRRSKLMQTYLYGNLNASQGGTAISEQSLGAAFGLKVIVARKSYDNALKGKATSVTPIWPNSYIFIGKIAGGDFMNGGLGRTIIWDADSPGGLFTSESYRDETRRGNMLRVRSNRVLKIVNPTAGQLLTTNFA
jgi:hypothetical protein